VSEPWTIAEQPTDSAEGVLTLVQGSAFCISSRSGDVSPGTTQGFFFRDTRFLTGFDVHINGHRAEGLAAERTAPFSATFVARSQPVAGRADSNLTLLRYRYVGRGMREDLVVRNYGEEPAYCSIQLKFSADFANLFAVKEGRARMEGQISLETTAGGLLFSYRKGVSRRGLRITSSEPAQFVSDTATWETVVPARGQWSTSCSSPRSSTATKSSPGTAAASRSSSPPPTSGSTGGGRPCRRWRRTRRCSTRR
jgi:hypothetical protein